MTIKKEEIKTATSSSIAQSEKELKAESRKLQSRLNDLKKKQKQNGIVKDSELRAGKLEEALLLSRINRNKELLKEIEKRKKELMKPEEKTKELLARLNKSHKRLAAERKAAVK